MKRRYLILIAVSCVFFLFAGCQQQAKVMSSKDKHIKLLSQKKLGERYQLALEITPPGEDTKKFTDTFTVNLTDGDVLEVTCQGIYKKAEQARGAAAPEAVAQKGEPKIEFESLVHDFGKVGPGQKLHGEFKFTNTGDAPLKITKVEKCCGAVTNLDKDELAPGESGVLKVQYTSSRIANKIMKRLYVNSNDKDTPRATLTIKAETVLKVDWEPKSLRLLLNEENAGCPKITLTSTENKPFSITSFKATNDALTTDFDDSVEATQFVLEPKVNIEELQKRTIGRINIGLAYPQPDTPPETASIIFRMLPRFSVRPSALMFFYSNPERPIKKYLSITNNYDEEFEIESMSSKKGRIKVFDQKKIGNRYQLELEITPKPSDDTKKITDTFTINLKDGQTLEATCRGTYKPAKVVQEPVPDASVASGKTAATEPDGPAPNVKPFLRASTRFRITPPAIVVFAEPHKPVARTISVVTNDDEDFEIDSVSSENGFVKVLRQERIDNGYRFEVEVTAPDPDAATGKFTDVLYVNVKDAERLSIRIYGRYLKR